MAINFLDNVQFNQNQLLGARLEQKTSDPSSGQQTGDIIYNSTSNKFKYYNGADWIDPATGGVTYTLPAGTTGTNNQAKITLTGSDSTTDVVTFTAAPSGGGLTLASNNAGNININVNYTASANNIINATSSSTGSSSQGYLIRTNGDSTTSQAVVKTKMSEIPLNNFGNPTATINFNSQKIKNLLDPTNAQDAATKNYVDTNIVGNLVFQGGYNANTNTPDLDSNPSSSIKKGWAYVVTDPGSFFTETVEVGDFLIAQQDAPTALANWVTVQNNIGLATTTTPGIASFPATQFGVTQAGAVSIKATGVTAGAYGSAASIPRITVNAAGQVTAATNNSFYGTADFTSNVGAAVATRQKVLTSSNATSHVFTHNFGTYNVTCELYDTANKDTVFATVDRTSINVVTATTSTSQSLTALIQKIG